MNSVKWPCSPWVLIGQWIECPPGVRVWFLSGTQIFFFVPCSCHVEIILLFPSKTCYPQYLQPYNFTYSHIDIEILTPEAVLTGLAFNFGSNTWQDKKEIPHDTKKSNVTQQRDNFSDKSRTNLLISRRYSSYDINQSWLWCQSILTGCLSFYS